VEIRTVTAEVWTQAFQAALDAGGRLHIPARGNSYYLDGPLVLKSGHN
jgi:polygalacturonase